MFNIGDEHLIEVYKVHICALLLFQSLKTSVVTGSILSDDFPRYCP